MERWKHVKLTVESSGSARQYVLQPWQPNIDLPRVSDGHTVQILNDLGFDGWELVSADATSDTYWLKRRREVEPEGDPHPNHAQGNVPEG